MAAGRRVVAPGRRPWRGASLQARGGGPTAVGGGQAPLRLASKLLRQLGKVRMTAGARRLVKAFLAGLYGRLSAEAERLRRTRKLPAAGAAEVRVALQRVMPGEVAKVDAPPPAAGP